MSLIHCSSDCLYQNEGYCRLDEASRVTNVSGEIGCQYFVDKKAAGAQKHSGGPTGRDEDKRGPGAF